MSKTGQQLVSQNALMQCLRLVGRLLPTYYNYKLITLIGLFFRLLVSPLTQMYSSYYEDLESCSLPL